MIYLGTPTAEAFLRDLPENPADAAAQCDGALRANRADPLWSPAEVEAVTQEFVRRKAAAERAALRGGR